MARWKPYKLLLPPEMHAALASRAKEHDTSMRLLMIEYITKGLEPVFPLRKFEAVLRSEGADDFLIARAIAKMSME